MPKLMNNLQQPPRDNPWLAHPTNRYFRTRFHQQCNYMLGFQVPKKINDSILEKKWRRNESNAKDDPYETLAFAYIKEMDQLVEANTITNKVEEEDSIICVDAKMMKLDHKEKNTMPKTQNPKKNMTNEKKEGPY